MYLRCGDAARSLHGQLIFNIERQVANALANLNITASPISRWS